LLVFSRVQQGVIAAAVLALIAAGGYVLIARGGPAGDVSFFDEPATLTGNNDFVLTVDVGGDVVRPGVYRLPPNSRTRDAIAAAGGLTSWADTSPLNLAAFLRDGDKVFVPRRGQTRVQYRPGRPSGVSTAGQMIPHAATPGQAHISINRATASELERLPGVGPAIAQRIVEYRMQHGCFVRLEDLMLVPGIGPKKFDQLRPYICL